MYLKWILCILALSITSTISIGIFNVPKYDPHIKRNVYQINDTASISPPDPDNHVAMARFVVHRALWVSMATFSTIPKIKGYPFSNIVSMSDGTIRKPTGVPYFYLTPLDYASKDLSKDNRCTISVTLEQTAYCREQLYDPDDPRCARVMLSGTIERMKNNTEEYEYAKNALFTRHPSMIDLPKNHGFYVAKLNIVQIVMLDNFGGAIDINLEQYFNYKNHI